MISFDKFYRIFQNTLQDLYTEPKEIESIFFLLTTHILKCDKTTILLRLSRKEKINFFTYEKLIKKLWELKKNRPIQYVIGQAYFWGMKFIVNEKVFIPRPETEELVYWILQDHKNCNYPVQVFDIGTGSGCISITLKKKKPEISHIHAIDFDQKALDIAHKNAKLHNVKISLKNIDILKNEIPSNMNKNFVHIIVSNPPYVKLSEKKLLHPNIVQYEPYQALFVPDEDPLIFYKKISFWIQKRLTGIIYVYFEINQFIYSDIIDLLKKRGFLNIEIRKDFQGFFRMVRAVYSANEK
ncbi:Protein methyltransferase hemK-like protein [Blattabacterium sp. (Nauphoeta cinerea)]|uniref:peptide chain release factor N(5)-glutamine methyltransferase n=1 Tax=Blattabacterium sp. (Nauphoeta cinerea) TaxID=1316444 RepID=UPI0003B0232C|nr:peptide chain release factor N(5)-glutamine methyltransferase [Blattabacterium sp. (Nauphoeta cinerea)]AGW86088.1 Protein methyltransferase hemK-like protein [Blattabacterium sp. (Nauphoeta cinerea)]